MLRLLVLASSVSLSVLAQSSAFKPCTLCADGSSGSLTKSFGTTPCSAIAKVIGATPADSHECLDIQMQAYQYCDCPTYPQEYCSLCPNGEYEIANPRQRIPTLPREGAQKNSFYTCSEVKFARKDEGDTCDILPSAAALCGCPGASPPTCSLCPDSKKAPDRRVPPDFKYTCSDLQALAALSTDCVELTTNSPIDIEAFCKCTDELPPPTCSLCEEYAPLPEGTFVVLDVAIGLSCGSLLNNIIPTVTSNDYCKELQYMYQGSCCTGAPTFAPTFVPTRRPRQKQTTVKPTASRTGEIAKAQESVEQDHSSNLAAAVTEATPTSSSASGTRRSAGLLLSAAITMALSLLLSLSAILL
jgi:hypothetical protein